MSLAIALTSEMRAEVILGGGGGHGDKNTAIADVWHTAAGQVLLPGARTEYFANRFRSSISSLAVSRSGSRLFGVRS